ncbi:MAG: rhomboid family intramembrane serine protease [Gemmatimonadetes bacterium]|nr:MAG: rhomboid family intramembrane serine protease [Gemmatimonadota bacterium]
MQPPLNSSGAPELTLSYAWTPMVKRLILINVGVWVLQILLALIGGVAPGSLSDQFIRTFGLVPESVYQHFTIWQFVSAMFLHSSTNMMHLIFNMFALWMFGSPVERVWGSREFFRYYMITGIGANMVHFMFYSSSPVAVIGASGAVLAVVLAFALTFPNAVILVGFLFPVKAKYFAIGVIVLDFLGLLMTEVGGQIDHVAHLIHLAGVGIGFGYLYFYKQQSPPPVNVFRKRKRTRSPSVERELDRTRVVDMVDRILDKINEQGIESLTEQERRILERASHLFSEEENIR